MVSEALRLFVGIDIGEAWTESLTATADDLRDRLESSVRWVRPELYHVTVVFLGNQPPEAVQSIDAVLAGAARAIEPFDLTLRWVGPMGRHQHAPLIARVHDPTGRLQRLRVLIDRELRQLGIAFDAQRLVPHVTLGRPRSRSGPIQSGYVGLQEAPSLSVREINLVKSDLRPNGPEYETIATAALGAR